MTWLLLVCGHELRSDERDEEGNRATSDYCNECSMWVSVVGAKDGDGQGVTAA